MTETLDHFFNRTFTNFSKDTVAVYGDKRRVGKPQVWSVLKAQEYVRYLESQ